jgi:hypothetical protein
MFSPSIRLDPGAGPGQYNARLETIDPPVRRNSMSIGRASKIAAGILFILAALGVSVPVLLVPVGLAVWVLGEAL